MQKVRVVGIEHGRISPELLDQLNRQLELVLEYGPVEHWVLLLCTWLVHLTLLFGRAHKNRGGCALAEITLLITVDVDERLTFFVMALEQQPYHRFSLLI